MGHYVLKSSVNTDDYSNTSNNATAIGVDSSTSGTINYGGDVDWFKFTTASAGIYEIYTAGSMDSYGYLYQGESNYLTEDDDDGDSFNFRISKSLSVNTTYYIKVRHYSSTSTGTYTINVKINGLINSELYVLKNAYSGKYLDVKYGGTSNGTRIWQNDLNGTVAQQWQLEYIESEGLFKLHPQCAPTQNLHVGNSSGSDGALIELNSVDDSGSRWDIVNLGSGKYKLVSKCSSYNKAMVVEGASQSSQAYVIQWQYNASVNDQWIFERKIEFTNSNASVNSQFDRSGAKSYAETYAETPNANYRLFTKDCTNFASQCLGDSQAGKLPHIFEEYNPFNWFYFHYYSYSNSWTVTDDFALHWGKLNGSGYSRSYKTIQYFSIKAALDDFNS